MYKFALLANAASLLFAHNHPSGDPSPSQDDLKLTRRLVQAGQILGVELLDALIIGHGTCLSLRERGLMAAPSSLVSERVVRTPDKKAILTHIHQTGEIPPGTDLIPRLGDKRLFEIKLKSLELYVTQRSKDFYLSGKVKRRVKSASSGSTLTPMTRGDESHVDLWPSPAHKRIFVGAFRQSSLLRGDERWLPLAGRFAHLVQPAGRHRRRSAAPDSTTSAELRFPEAMAVRPVG